MKQKIKKIIRTGLDVLWLVYGLFYYWFTKRTPAQAHLAMIRLFCLSSGRTNDWLSWLITLFDKPLTLPDHNGVLGSLSLAKLEHLNEKLEQDGFVIFDQKLPADLIQSLKQFALEADCIPRRLDDQDPNEVLHKTKYNPTHLRSNVYDICGQAVVSNPQVQRLLCDHSILAVAQRYLKCSPKVEPPVCWWSTPFSNKPQVNAAQQYHFDMDRIKWLKFFIFLTDVTIANGPHVFVTGSHRTKGIPRALLKAGYSRLKDEEIAQHYPPEKIQTFIVPAGTILAEDTRGLHKGTHLLQGERLVLEFQYSNSLFGAVTPLIDQVALIGTPLGDPSWKY